MPDLLKRSIPLYMLGIYALLVCLSCKDTRQPVIRENMNLTESLDIFEKPLIPKAEAVTDEKIVASVNGIPILHSQLVSEAKVMAARLRNQLPPERIDQERDNILNQALNSLMIQTLLLNSMESENVKVQDSEVDAALGKIRETLPSNISFTDFLRQGGLTETGLVEKIRIELGVQALVKQSIGEPPPPTEEEIAAFYEANKEQFKVPDRVAADYILLLLPKDADPALIQERTTLASTLHTSLAGGRTISELLAEYPGSDIVRGGSETFARGQIEKEQEEILFALETNQTSKVSTSSLGLHIFQAREHLPAGILPLAQVKENISNSLARRENQNRVNAFITDLREKADIKILP